MVSGCWTGLARAAGWAELALRQVRLRFDGGQVRFSTLQKAHVLQQKRKRPIKNTWVFDRACQIPCVLR